MDIESIDNLDEAMILGYFETIRSVFLTKTTCLVAITKKEAPRLLDFAALPADAWQSVAASFEDQGFLAAARAGNAELLENFQEDIVSGVVIDSWVVFEQVIKELLSPAFAQHGQEVSVAYNANRFQFTEREKRDIDFFYYLRNAHMHSNGAFTAIHSIDHHYNGQHFKSTGSEGIKMVLNMETAWRIAKDLERYTCKAWTCAMKSKK